MTLHCTKTGRHWPCASEGQARQMARNLGVTDYTFCPPGTAPATIRETTAAMIVCGLMDTDAAFLPHIAAPDGRRLIDAIKGSEAGAKLLPPPAP